MPEVDLSITGRSYRVGCRAGEEDTLRAAAALVDDKSREALAGLGTMTEARQLLFASLLLADQLLERKTPPAGASAPAPDPALVGRVVRLAERIEALADTLENAPANA